MKKLIEVINWEHEGEYDQYFFVVEDEETFIKEMMKYLNTIIVEDKYPWSEPLSEYKKEQQVEPFFLIGDTPHLKETYYLEFNYDNKFTIGKRSLEYKFVDIKMNNPFKKMKVEVYQCPECKQWIYSRARHDMKHCKCGKCAVDGGHLAEDNIWKPERIIGPIVESKTVELEVDDLTLYNDWNESENEWGTYEEPK